MTRFEALWKARNGCAMKDTAAYGRVYAFLHGGVRTEGSRGDHGWDWRWLTPDETVTIGDDGWIKWDIVRRVTEHEQDRAEAQRDQARRNAAWWRKEMAHGRITGSLSDFEWLLRDLETAGRTSEDHKLPDHRAEMRAGVVTARREEKNERR